MYHIKYCHVHNINIQACSVLIHYMCSTVHYIPGHKPDLKPSRQHSGKINPEISEDKARDKDDKFGPPLCPVVQTFNCSCL